jgi:hypothetical protein
MIERFEFADEDSKWILEPITFSTINLLVGVSGVGKSRILRALSTTASCGAGVAPAPPTARWALRATVDNQRFDWEVETGAAVDAGPNTETDGPLVLVSHSRARRGQFLKERLIDGHGNLVASRDGDEVVFSGKATPKLKPTESLISLLQKEDLITPLHESLSHVFMSSIPEFEFTFWPRKQIARWGREIQSIDQLRQAVRVPLLVRFDLLQRLAPDEYEGVVASFSEIFDTVKSVKVGPAAKLLRGSSDEEEEEDESLTVAVEEEGISRPLRLRELSSGMRRTLRHLAEVALAPSGSTILIDEYENSLGVNCLPSVTRHLLNRARDIQLIATSHHPYVINNIDLKHWRVVARRGCSVRVVSAAEIPELQTASRQEAFVRLMNSDTYRRGAAGA